MHIPFFHQRERNLNTKLNEPHPAIKHHELHHDTSEGAEFVDDAIHMEELSVTQTEVSVAAGSPGNLL